VGTEVCVARRHPEVAVPKDLSGCPEGHAFHRERRRCVVPQVVERKVFQPEPLDEAREAPGEDDRWREKKSGA
jgi:hypothetical protein